MSLRRTGPPKRYQALTAHTELRRTESLARTPMQRQPSPRSSIRQSRRATVYERDAGRCVRCGRPVGAGDRQVHHRVARGLGGRVEHDRLSALITLCGVISTDPNSCHQRVESRRLEAQASGFLVPMGVEPTDWSIHCHDGWFLLTDDGQRVPTTDPGATGQAVD